MDTLKKLVDVVLHLDRYLEVMSNTMGGWLYAALFAVVFCETGLIVTPFLPGDSLLFAVGALIAIPGANLSFPLMFVLLLIGRALGPKVFHSETSRFLNKQHLEKAQAFYQKYGGKAIFLARFLPIVRTFAPFVAGIGKMDRGRFWMFNVSGAICWVGIFLTAGYFFGGWKPVKENFSLVTLGIIVVSVLPVIYEWYKARQEAAQQKPETN